MSEATYECDSGYEIFGPSTVKCDPVKGWEKEMPFCGKFNNEIFYNIFSFSQLNLFQRSSKDFIGINLNC